MANEVEYGLPSSPRDCLTEKARGKGILEGTTI